MSHVLFLFGLTLISTLINGEISVHEPIEGVFNLLERVKSPQSSCQARIMTNNRDFQRFNRGTKPAQIGSCGYIDYPKNHCTLVTFIDCPNEFYPRFFARLSLGRRMWNDIYIVVNTNASLSIERVISPHIKNINDIVFMNVFKDDVQIGGWSNPLFNGSRKLVHLDGWNNRIKRLYLGRIHKLLPFADPKTPLNLQGQPFKVAYRVRNYNIDMIDRNGNGSDLNNIVGTEVNAVMMMSKKFNMTLSAEQYPDMITGFFHPRLRKWTGFIGMVMDGEIDAALWGVPVAFPFMAAIDYISVPLDMWPTKVTFYAPIPLDLPPWQTVLYAYKLPVWLGLLISSALFLTMLSILSRINEELMPRSRPVLRPLSVLQWMMASLTGRGPALVVHNENMKFIVCSWLVFATIFHYSYNSSMATSLTIKPKAKPILTWKELYDSDCPIVIPDVHFLTTYFTTATEVSNNNYYRIWKKVQGQPEDWSKRAWAGPFNREILIRDYRMCFVWFAGAEQAIDTKGNIIATEATDFNYPVLMSIPMRKNYPYLKHFQYHMGQIRDMGIVTQSAVFAFLKKNKYMTRKDKMTVRLSAFDKNPGEDNQNVSPLNTGQIQSVLLLLAAGLGISFCTLLGEWINSIVARTKPTHVITYY